MAPGCLRRKISENTCELESNSVFTEHSGLSVREFRGISVHIAHGKPGFHHQHHLVPKLCWKLFPSTELGKVPKLCHVNPQNIYTTKQNNKNSCLGRIFHMMFAWYFSLFLDDLKFMSHSFLYQKLYAKDCILKFMI